MRDELDIIRVALGLDPAGEAVSAFGFTTGYPRTSDDDDDDDDDGSGCPYCGRDMRRTGRRYRGNEVWECPNVYCPDQYYPGDTTTKSDNDDDDD